MTAICKEKADFPLSNEDEALYVQAHHAAEYILSDHDVIPTIEFDDFVEVACEICKDEIENAIERLSPSAKRWLLNLNPPDGVVALLQMTLKRMENV